MLIGKLTLENAILFSQCRKEIIEACRINRRLDKGEYYEINRKIRGINVINRNRNTNDMDLIMNVFRAIKRNLGIVLIVVILIMAAMNSFYRVPTDEVAVVYTLGEQSSVVESGGHFKIPYIQTIKKVKNTRAIIPIHIGYRDNGNQQYVTVDEESKMLTGDNKIVQAEWLVEAYIADPNKAMFNIKDPQEVIRKVCLTNMRKLVNSVTLEYVTTTGRGQIAPLINKGIDEELKNLDIGYGIRTIQIQDIQPPERIAEAYKQVNEAKLKTEQEISKAKSEEAVEVNKAKSEVAKIRGDADAEKDKIITKAKGDVAEYFSMLEMAKMNKDMTKRQLLVNMLEKLLQKAKVIIDDGNGTIKYMNIDELAPKQITQ